MKHEKHPWFIRDSNPVPLGQKSGALTTELPGYQVQQHKTRGFLALLIFICKEISIFFLKISIFKALGAWMV
jgi:hypothetical protein